MPLAHNVPADKLIKALAEHLKENVKEMAPPAWASYSKTGIHVERIPTQPNFWYLRSASLMRRLYTDGPVGIERLRTVYGGRSKKGMINEHFYKSASGNLRKALQQLEAAGLVAKVGNRGRILTDKGTSMVDRAAYKLLRDLQKDIPSLNKYLPVKVQQ